MRKWPSPRCLLSALLVCTLLAVTLSYRRQSQTADSPKAVANAAIEDVGNGDTARKGVHEGKEANVAALGTTELRGPVPQAGLPDKRRPSLTAVCVSDTHGLYEEAGLIKVPKGDMLLFPGDAAVGTATEGLRFSRWLEGLPVTGPRVITWGNMDTATPGLPDPVPGATVLVNAIQEVNGYRIFGSPWTPRFAGAYQLDMSEEESFNYWSQLLPPNADVDIILTHGPPFGIADGTGGTHRGDKGLLRAVQALERPPLLWVCGHIHEQYGEHRVPHPRSPPGAGGRPGGILLVNSAVFYVQRPGHEEAAQPRAVRLPEAVVVPRGGAATGDAA